MATVNTVTLAGNLTRDPELKYSQNGTAICRMGLAYNKRTRTESGEWEDGDPLFFDLVVFSQLGENAAETLTKGERVIVTGNLHYSSWQADDGSNRSRLEVIVDEIGPSLLWAHKSNDNTTPDLNSAVNRVHDATSLDF